MIKEEYKNFIRVWTGDPEFADWRRLKTGCIAFPEGKRRKESSMILTGGSDDMAAFVSMQGVVKEYKMGEVTIRAADGVNFEIEKGEFCVIVGPSGAGKTTVLNIWAGWTAAREAAL